MKVGGTRRLSILPQMGWEKPSKSCDGGPGGSGNGGELKTDYGEFFSVSFLVLQSNTKFI